MWLSGVVGRLTSINEENTGTYASQRLASSQHFFVGCVNCDEVSTNWMANN
jgi:hypothetical protein